MFVIVKGNGNKLSMLILQTLHFLIIHLSLCLVCRVLLGSWTQVLHWG